MSADSTRSTNSIRTPAAASPPPHSTPAASPTVWNLPNQLSAARIVLSIACFFTIVNGWYLASLVLFLVAVATDWLDGQLARRFGQITQLGRILDPFADKVIVCGTFILLGAVEGSQIAAWVAVIVTARELLVTALRGICEGQGSDFSAKWIGKWKMVLQSLAISLSLWRLSQYPFDAAPPWFDSFLLLVVTAAVLITVYSGWVYVRRAIELLNPRG